MAFLGTHDILVLEKNTGEVRRIANDHLLPNPLLSANVSISEGGGMLGIAIARTGNHTYVFLSLIESGAGKPYEDIKTGKAPLGNRLYRYELIDDKLVHPKLFASITAWPGPLHYGGPIVIGPDKNVYWVVGDDGPANGHLTQAQNIRNAPPADGTGGILRFTINGTAVGSGILGSQLPLRLYYAYGIRNSFGMAFDPVTGKLWDTENGPTYGDEINLVEPGFNSGWKVIQGIASRSIAANQSKFDAALSMDEASNASSSKNPNLLAEVINQLVSFGGKGKYSDPKFEWQTPVAPTALSFLNSDKLGGQYKNDMFVGDYNYGRIYHFKLDPNRTGLSLTGPLSNMVAETDGALQNVTFGSGFAGITDIKVGPDGYLYIVSINNGSIYKIIPKNELASHVREIHKSFCPINICIIG
jgi:aldose sugar dehydrogenase